MPILRIVALSAVLSLLGFSAQAVTTTYKIDFTASNFNLGAPIDPVFGSFTVTFDPDGAASDNVPVDAVNLNTPVDGTTLFQRSEGATNVLISGNNDTELGRNTNDFIFNVIDFFTRSPIAGFDYCVSSGSGCPAGPFRASQVSVSVSTVPLPPAAAFLLAGLGGLMVLCRRGHPQMRV
ncbi:MAG: hypothetical protein AAGH74_13965 [Pseudomonadota bacterium]